MSESLLTHVTQCVICGTRPKPFRIDAHGFEPIPQLGPPSKKAEDFGKKLFTHIALEADRESGELNLNTNGGTLPKDLAEAAVYRMARAPHLAYVPVMLQLEMWAKKWGLLAAFKTTDPELEKARDCARYALHASTTDVSSIPDDRSLEMSAAGILGELELIEGESQKILVIAKALKELRASLIQPPAPEGMQPFANGIQIVSG